MTHQEIDLTVRQVASKLFSVKLEGLRRETDLATDLGADSMALIEFVISLEEAFNSQMDHVVDMEVRTIGDVIDVITRHLNKEDNA